MRTVEFDVIRTVASNTSSSQKIVEPLDVWPRLEVSPLENREHTISRILRKDVSLAYNYGEGVSYQFTEHST